MNEVTNFVPGMLCPCGCGVSGSKLSFKTKHVARYCECVSCRNSRNVRKGKRAQAKGHRALGGIGFTPSNEESTGGYPIRVQVEHKTGAQIPASFWALIHSKWFLDALDQAQRAIRIGDGSHPAVMFDGRWVLVDAKAIGVERKKSEYPVLASEKGEG